MSVSEGNTILQQIDGSNESGILIPISFVIQRKLNEFGTTAQKGFGIQHPNQ